MELLAILPRPQSTFEEGILVQQTLIHRFPRTMSSRVTRGRFQRSALGSTARHHLGIQFMMYVRIRRSTPDINQQTIMAPLQDPSQLHLNINVVLRTQVSMLATITHTA